MNDKSIGLKSLKESYDNLVKEIDNLKILFNTLDQKLTSKITTLEDNNNHINKTIKSIMES